MRKGIESENSQILHAIDRVIQGVGNKGISAIDRGAARSVLLQRLLSRGPRFLARMVGRNDLILRDRAKKKALKIAWDCHCPHHRQMIIQREGELKGKTISVGHTEVKLAFHGQWLSLVAVKGLDEKPLMLLTNLSVDSLGTMSIVEIYLTRWKCEESYRFIKQGYSLEDIRVLSYTALRNMVVLVQAVFYFISVELGKKLRLSILLKKIFEKAKRFFEIPEFRQYAIADAIYRKLFASKTGITPHLVRREAKGQLLMLFAVQLW